MKRVGPGSLKTANSWTKLRAPGSVDVVVTADQNIRHWQNLTNRKLALVVLGSNIWPIVRNYEATIAATVDAATPGSYGFIDMPLPRKARRPSGTHGS